MDVLPLDPAAVTFRVVLAGAPPSRRASTLLFHRQPVRAGPRELPRRFPLTTCPSRRMPAVSGSTCNESRGWISVCPSWCSFWPTTILSRVPWPTNSWQRARAFLRDWRVDRRRLQIVARSLGGIPVRPWIPRAPIGEIEDRVVRPRDPDRRSAGLPIIAAPCLVAGFAGTRDGIKAPHFLSRHGVEGRDEAANAIFATRDADDDISRRAAPSSWHIRRSARPPPCATTACRHARRRRRAAHRSSP